MTDEKERLTDPIKCNHCGNLAPMSVVSGYSDTEILGGKGNEPPWETGTIYQILKCPSCRKISIRSYFWHDGMDDEDRITYQQLYPVDARMPEGLPDKISKAYQAAVKVKTIDANAFAVLLGRVIDMVCQDRGASGDTMAQQLADLAQKNEIPIKLVEVAAKLRKLRNIGAHAGLGELTDKDVPILEDLCRALLDYIYTAPHLISRADKSLERLMKI